MSKRPRSSPPLALHLELRHLRLIEAIAATGSVSRAAERLFLSQPAVSHALRGLEQRLGEALFERRKSGMAVTPLGERFLAAAREVLATVAQLGASLEAAERPLLRITTQCYTRYPWLPDALAALEGAEQPVSLEIVAEAAARPLDALVEGAVDLAIVYDRPADAGLPGLHLGRDELVAVLPTRHPLAGRPHVRPSELAAEHLYLHSSPKESAVVREFLAPAGVEARALSALQYSEAVLDVVSRGLGVTVVSRWVLDEEERGRFSVCSLGEAGLHRDWWLAGRPGSWEDEPVRSAVALVSRGLAGRMRAADGRSRGS